MGIVIKFMDDYLDEEMDKLKENNELNYSSQLHKGILPYSLIFFVLALYFNFQEALSLFFASYIIGMTFDFRERLPSYLYGWQESLIALTLSIILTTFFTTFSSLILIILLQLCDDFLDYRQDIIISETNYLNNLGAIPFILIVLILLLISFKYFPVKLLYFTIAVISLYIFDYTIIKLTVNRN